MNASRGLWRKAKCELHNNSTCYSEQIQEDAHHKTAAVMPLLPMSQTIQIWRTRHTGHCCRSTDKLINGVLWSYLPTPPLGLDMTQMFKRSLTGLNSEFSFSSTSCLTKAEEPSLSYYLPIAGGRIIGFIPFPRVLVLCEMQSASSRIWTCVAVSISYDDNHYTTVTFIMMSSDRFLHEHIAMLAD